MSLAFQTLTEDLSVEAGRHRENEVRTSKLEVRGKQQTVAYGMVMRVQTVKPGRLSATDFISQTLSAFVVRAQCLSSVETPILLGLHSDFTTLTWFEVRTSQQSYFVFSVPLCLSRSSLGQFPELDAIFSFAALTTT